MNNINLEIALVRNKLFSGKFDKEDIDLLSSWKINSCLLSSEFKNLSLNAIDNCLESISKNDLDVAARELNLIHNFSFNNFSEWDSDYFYRAELLGYIEMVGDTKRIKKLILLLSKLPDK